MSLHFVVCIKSVVKSAPRGVARRTPENSELNPFDRPALEAALRLREQADGTVTSLSMGPAVSREALAEAMAMGVDAAVLVSDRALAESDTLVTSRVLAAAIHKLDPFDLLLFGTRTADSDTGQVGPQTAALLEVPFISGVKAVEPAAEEWSLRRTMDGWEELWQVRPPAAATIDPRAYAPRPVSLAKISAVYDAPSVQQWSLEDLELDPAQVGLAGSPTRVAALETIRRQRQCRMLTGEPRSQVEELMEHLTRTGAIGS